MLTKKEIMEVFSGRGCTVEDEAKDENWFFYTRDGFHYEVQVDVDRNRPDRKLLIIICPYMGKVEERHGHLLERAVNMMKEDLKNEDIDNYQLNYNPDDCSLDACIGIYYENCSKQDLDRKLASTFELDDRVNDVMAKNLRSWLRAEETEKTQTEQEGEEMGIDETRFDLYPLQFWFIPQLLKEVDNDYNNLGIMIDFKFWRESLEGSGFKEFGFDWNDIEADAYAVNEKLDIVLYTFPYPEREGMALHGLVVIDKTGMYPYKYYTMERPGDDLIGSDGKPAEWFVCSMEDDEHENYGSCKISSAHEFAFAVLANYEELLSE